MDEKTLTTAAYDEFAEAFDAEFERHMRQYNMGHAERFLRSLHGPRILDIGSGPGNYAAEFAKRGFDVFCGDVSPKMVELCRRKGLVAEVLDLETFDLDRRFDGVWANACLLHLPKAKIPDALDRIAGHLETEGVFACGVKEGSGERLQPDDDYPGTQRFFSHYNDDEFRALLAPHFLVERFERTPSASGKTVFIKYLARPRRS